MRQIFYLLIVLILGTNVCGQPPTKSYLPDSTLKQCIEKDGSTIGMISCLVKARESWDKELNKSFKLLLTKLDTSDQRKLRDSQRQWIIYRDKEVNFFGSIYRKREGTMWNVVISDKTMQLTRQRAVDLLEYYETLTQD